VEDQGTETVLRENLSPDFGGEVLLPDAYHRLSARTRGGTLITTINSAELIKHASNSFLAMKISYANIIADLCEKVDADIHEVTHAMGMDPRIGPAFLNAGPGIRRLLPPKDVQAFIRLAERCGVDSGLLREVERVNKRVLTSSLKRSGRRSG